MTENLTDRAYRHIHQKLLGSQFVSGTRLSKRAVAKELGISYTPVRDALNRLVSEGLLEYRAGVGAFVPASTRQDIQDIYELRETLECAAVKKVAGRLSDEYLAELEGHLDKIDAIMRELKQTDRSEWSVERLEQWRLLDSAFHMTLLRAAGNRRVLETVGDLNTKAQIVCHRFQTEGFDSLVQTQEEHHRIIDALRGDDADHARRMMAEHIRGGCRTALAAHDHRYVQKAATHHMKGLHGAIEVEQHVAEQQQNSFLVE
jgi:DNA-binding GntR family transcriptional regulator